VRLRINSGVHASTHDYLATAREDQKFGIPLAEAPDVVAQIRAHDSLRFLGLHSHIGSQIFESDGFSEAARRLLAVHAELLAGGDVPELNLGGGFGIAYTSVDEVTPISEIAADFARVVSSESAALGIPMPVVAIEPGRAVIGPSTVTLYEVGTTKNVVVSVVEPVETTVSSVNAFLVQVEGVVVDQTGLADLRRDQHASRSAIVVVHGEEGLRIHDLQVVEFNEFFVHDHRLRRGEHRIDTAITG
jgi:diaminopimelate decarboxylase